MEGLGHFLKHASSTGGYKGTLIYQDLNLTHLLFVDDILIFCGGSRRDMENICNGLALFKRASEMVINAGKSTSTCSNLAQEEIKYIAKGLSFPVAGA